MTRAEAIDKSPTRTAYRRYSEEGKRYIAISTEDATVRYRPDGNRQYAHRKEIEPDPAWQDWLPAGIEMEKHVVNEDKKG